MLFNKNWLNTSLFLPLTVNFPFFWEMLELSMVTLTIALDPTITFQKTNNFYYLISFHLWLYLYSMS